MRRLLPVGGRASVRATTGVDCRGVCGEADLAAHYRIRHGVFVVEQGIFAGSDVDDRDRAGETIRLVAVSGGEVVGTVRCYRLSDSRWQGDRLAVLPAFRAGGVAAALVAGAVAAASARGGTEMLAFVQLANVAFFERRGWTSVAGPVSYAGLPHQEMETCLRADSAPAFLNRSVSAPAERETPEPSRVERLPSA